MRSLFARVGAWCVERPAPVIAAAVLVAIVGAVGALSLQPDGGTDSLVDSGSKTFQGTEDFQQKFGDDAVVILVRGDLRRLLLTNDLPKLLSLENCLAGTPASETQAELTQAGVSNPPPSAPAVCDEIAQLKPAQAVYGPATFLDQFAQQAGSLLSQQTQAATQQGQQIARTIYQRALNKGLSKTQAKALAERSAQQPLQQLQQQLYGIAVKYGLTGVPKLTDPSYVSSVVFDSSQAAGTPKAKFSYLFPGPDAALISARLRPDLSDGERRQAIDLFRQAVDDPAFRLRGGDYVVSGVPVVVEGLTTELQSGILVLLIAALLVMAIVLAIVFGPPLRLLPLGVALGSSAIAFGVLALFGGSLTMASIAVLPVLIGLSVDYAIQFHARFTEALAAGSSPARAAVQAAASGGPVIATAALATGAGFLVLLLSPIPMVRSFGLLLVLGIAVAFLLALTAALTVLSMTRAPRSPRSGGLGERLPRPRPGSIIGRTTSTLARGRERARRAAAGAGARSLALSISKPGRVLAVGGVLAVIGWGVGTQTSVISDIRQLVPSDLPALRDVDTLQDATGVSGEVDVVVRSSQLTSPEVVRWMGDYENRVLALGGFEPGQDSCRTSQAKICPSTALPDLFASNGVPNSQQRIADALQLLPPRARGLLVETDPSTGAIGQEARIAFGIKVMPLDEQKKLIDGLRDAIDANGGPPAGVEAQVVGLPVLAADANSALSSNRYLLTAIGLLAVALALLAVYRSIRRALVPLIPIVFATGWSALVVELAGVPLNPMSATLGALVIAIATEFSVLLAARFEEERTEGRALGESLRRAYSRTGVAVVASGLTAIAGFAALTVSDIRMLRDFGLVTVLDLGVALTGVLLVLPAALVWAESGFAPIPAIWRRLRPRRSRRSSAPAG